MPRMVFIRGINLLNFHNTDIVQRIVGLRHDDVRDDGHVLPLQAALGRSHRNRNALAGHVGHAVGIALRNDQAFDLGSLSAVCTICSSSTADSASLELSL